MGMRQTLKIDVGANLNWDGHLGGDRLHCDVLTGGFCALLSGDFRIQRRIDAQRSGCYKLQFVRGTLWHYLGPLPDCALRYPYRFGNSLQRPKVISDVRFEHRK